MRDFYIKKKITAETMLDALKNEQKAQITDVWSEDVKVEEQTPAIGFEIDRVTNKVTSDTYGRRTNKS